VTLLRIHLPGGSKSTDGEASAIDSKWGAEIWLKHSLTSPDEKKSGLGANICEFATIRRVRQSTGAALVTE
jgi:hypothetical protein